MTRLTPGQRGLLKLLAEEARSAADLVAQAHPHSPPTWTTKWSLTAAGREAVKTTGAVG